MKHKGEHCQLLYTKKAKQFTQNQYKMPIMYILLFQRKCHIFHLCLEMIFFFLSDEEAIFHSGIS